MALPQRKLKTTKIIPNEDKLRELIVYVAQRSAIDPSFGATKLNKILFHADFLAYGLLGKPITGVEYMKQERGPVPRRMKPIRDDMEKRGDIAIEKVPYFNMPRSQDRVVARRNAILKPFSPDEISLVDQIIYEFWGQSGTDISQETHGYRGWKIARELGDTIPYNAVFLSDEAITEYEIQHAHELIEKHRWAV